MGRQHRRAHFSSICDIRIFLLFLLSGLFGSLTAAENHTFEAESAEPLGGTSRFVDSAASGGYTARLTAPGDGIRFTGLPSAGTLAIRYASGGVGLISVTVNNQPERRVYCGPGPVAVDALRVR